MIFLLFLFFISAHVDSYSTLQVFKSCLSKESWSFNTQIAVPPFAVLEPVDIGV